MMIRRQDTGLGFIPYRLPGMFGFGDTGWNRADPYQSAADHPNFVASAYRFAPV